MRTIQPRRAVMVAAVFLGMAPAGVSLLHAQELKCYTEVCVRTSSGGESCVEKPVPCPPT